MLMDAHFFNFFNGVAKLNLEDSEHLQCHTKHIHDDINSIDDGVETEIKKSQASFQII